MCLVTLTSASEIWPWHKSLVRIKVYFRDYLLEKRIMVMWSEISNEGFCSCDMNVRALSFECVEKLMQQFQN